jgi:hypothetical protein
MKERIIMATETATDWRAAIKFLGGSPEKENQLLQEMAQQIRLVVANFTDNNGGVPRRALHAKMIAGVNNAAFVVSHDMAADLRVDFLQPGASYPAVVRFSNAAGFFGDKDKDSKPDLRGVAFRVTPPAGAEQDFLMTNAEEHHAQNALEAMATTLAFSREGVLQQIVDFVEGPGGNLLHTLEGIRKADDTVSGILELASCVGAINAAHILRTLSKQMKEPVSSLATETYWSRAPLRIGEVVVKYLLLPKAQKVKSVEPDLRGEFRTRLEKEDVRFEFQVQRYIDERRTPLEDARKPWDSPHETIAELVIPRQSLAEDEEFFEGLQFNPWHVNTSNFEPVGNMNRARRVVYPAAVKARGRALA